MTQSALVRRFPETATLPRIEFADLPTPVERLESLGEYLDIDELYVKRDDRSGPLYGGNKVRKLEFLLADALEEGHDQVWTIGAIGSHHVLATSIYARQQGLKPAALHFPQPVTDHVLDNLRALSTTQPDLTLVGNKAEIPIEVLRTKIREWLASGPEVYYIPAGGSSPTGAVGYVNAVLELAEQIRDNEMPVPDTIFVAAGTCGTLAGLTLGCRLAGLETEVIGVRVVDRFIANKPLVASLARRTAALLEEHGLEDAPRLERDDVTLLHDYFGDDYGEPTSAGRRAIGLASDLEGLDLDPTYTGKTLAGLIGARDELDLTDQTVLYWHTLNSVDLSDRIASARISEDLPADYQHYFE